MVALTNFTLQLVHLQQGNFKHQKSKYLVVDFQAEWKGIIE